MKYLIAVLLSVSLLAGNAFAGDILVNTDNIWDWQRSGDGYDLVSGPFVDDSTGFVDDNILINPDSIWQDWGTEPLASSIGGTYSGYSEFEERFDPYTSSWAWMFEL